MENRSEETNILGVKVWHHQHGYVNGKRVAKCEAPHVTIPDDDGPCLDGWYYLDTLSKAFSGPYASMHEAFKASKIS